MDDIRPLEELLDSVRGIEGFPIGKDDDIIDLSNPPYYTASPNPFIKDFITQYGKLYDEENDEYDCKPFIDDISEGKGDVIYNLHTYHTKVPPKAIVQKILHYTNPDDIVLDGFCGSGMTGVASALCGVSEIVNKFNTFDTKKIGVRPTILSDISPVCSLIAHVYNSNHDLERFNIRANEILDEVDNECLWMYETEHAVNNKVVGKGVINYTVWSDVFVCSYCSSEFCFWDAGVDTKEKRNKSNLVCPSCKADITKINLKRKVDENSHAIIKPVLIIYEYNNKKFEKQPSDKDIEILNKIENLSIPYWYPTDKLPEGYNTAQPKRSHGLHTVDSFFTKRNLYSTAAIFDKILKTDINLRPLLLFWLQSVLLGQTKLNRYFEASYSQVNRYLKGTLYVGKKISEVYYRYSLRGKLQKLSKYLNFSKPKSLVSVNSATHLNIPENSIDYIFVDPPFGGNIMYSELNFIWESWLKVKTNIRKEAIVNDIHNKSNFEYAQLMGSSFKEFYRVLKPNRWITIEFHNSNSSIWNIIQNAINGAGFIISNVSVLDKKQETFKQMTSPSSVKNDLIISAFKPTGSFSKQFLELAGEGLESNFIDMHLNHLPIQPTIERTEQMLYSKLLAFYVQHSYTIRYDSNKFYKMLRKMFTEIDGYWFTDSQIKAYNEYRQKLRFDGINEISKGMTTLFVSDEKSALIWLHTFLDTPKDFQSIHPAFHKVASITGDVVPDLKQLLVDNFISEEGKYRRPQSEDEKLSVTQKRERELSRDFESILLEAKASKRKIKEVRRQSLVYGFEQCYKANRFADILAVAKRLDRSILENNSDITEFIEVAEMKMEGF